MVVPLRHVGLVLLLAAGLTAGKLLQPCTVDNFGTMFTQCSYQGGNVYTRDRVVYLADPSCNLKAENATNLGSAELANSGIIAKYDLSCSCSAGQYMDDDTGECEPCDAGQFTIEGTTFDDEDFFLWNLEYMSGTAKVNDPVPGVTSSCTGPACDGWSYDWGLGGLSSGNNWNNDNIETDLTIIRDFVLDSGNQVSFSYRVDAEKCWLDNYACDGFAFYVDQQKVLPADPKKKRISQQPDFVTFTMNLTQGTHLMRWVYSKDDSFSGNEDKAFIQYINFIGSYDSTDNLQASDRCHLCPAGSAAPTNGSTSCTLCDWFEYQPQSGMDKCLACPTATMSAPGSTLCVTMPNCTSDDYYRVRPPISSCELENGVWMSTHTYNWSTVTADGVSRKLCYGGPALPPPVRKPCLCAKGQQIISTGGTPRCADCPINQYGDGQNCYPCNSSTVPVHAAIFDTWMDPIPTTCNGPSCISSLCVGDCAPETTGWLPRGGFVSSGRTIGSVYSTLTIQDVPVAKGAQLSIVCAVDCFAPGQTEYSIESSCDLNFTVYNSSGAIVSQFSCQEFYFEKTSAYNNTVFWRAPVADTYSLTAAFWQNSTEKDVSKVYEARIYSITFDRLTSTGPGNVVRCELCPLGTYHVASPNADFSCSPCPIGQESTVPPTGTCAPCTGNAFNAVPGRQCLECGATTTVNSTHTGCDIHGCKFVGQVSGRTYDFNALSQPGGDMLTAGIVQQWGWPPIAPQIFYLNPCTTKHSNRYCRDANNQSLPYMACQTTQDGVYDLGSVIGFIETALGSVTMTFTGGTPCGSINRETNVSMVCDVAAGFGNPQKPDGDIEGALCRYNFVWVSQYACPVCRDSDYQLVAGVCSAGVQRLFYVPIAQCSGSKPDTYVPCVTPKVTDVPPPGFAYVLAVIALANNTSPDIVALNLSYALDVSTSSIIVVQEQASNVTVRVSVQDEHAAIENITSRLAQAVKNSRLGTLVSSPSVIHPLAPSSNTETNNYIVPVVIVVLIALVALAVAGVFYWKNRQLKYQNYRLVKEAGQDNGISNELYNDDNEEPVLRPTGGGMRFLNQNTSVNFGDDDDDLAS